MWRTAFTVIVGALAVVFDTTIVTVALHRLATELDAPPATVQWVSTGYPPAVFVAIPLAGWAQSRLGGRRLRIASLGVFLLGSVLSAPAWNAAALIVFRVVQGIGGGIMMPLMATLVIQAAEGRNIGTVMAAVTLPTALGPVLGPVLGGVIPEPGRLALDLLRQHPLLPRRGLARPAQPARRPARARQPPHPPGRRRPGSCSPRGSPPSSTDGPASGTVRASSAPRCSYRCSAGSPWSPASPSGRRGAPTR